MLSIVHLHGMQVVRGLLWFINEFEDYFLEC